MFYFCRVFILYTVLFAGLTLGMHHYLVGQFPDVKGESRSMSLFSEGFSGYNVRTKNTYTGTFLAGMAAQNRRDWAGARTIFSQLNDNFDTNPLMVLRLMTLALGAGDYDHVIEIATKIQTEFLSDENFKDDNETFDLARLFLIAKAFKDNDFEKVDAFGKELHHGALAAFSQPIVEFWAESKKEKPHFTTSIKKLSGLQSIHKALAAEASGEIETAKKLFKKISRKHISSQTAEMIGAFYVRHKEMNMAVDLLRRSLVLYANNSVLRKAYTAVKKNDGSYEPPYFATAHLNGAATGLGMAFHDFARIMVMERAVDSGLLFARIAAYLDPQVPGVAITMGEILLQQDQKENALIIYGSIPVEDHDYVHAQIEKADILRKLGRVDEGISALERISVANNGNRKANVYLALGSLYKDQKEFEKAITAYDIAENLGLSENNGKDPEWLWFLRYFRGIAFDLLDRSVEAQADLNKALETRPNNATILNYLGYSYADKGENLAKAQEMIFRAVTQNPDDAYIVDSMGWVLYRMGKYDEAVEYLEKAAHLRPYNAVVNDHLGDAYWKVGRRLEAHYMWQRTVDYVSKDADLNSDEMDEADAARGAKKKLLHGLLE